MKSILFAFLNNLLQVLDTLKKLQTYCIQQMERLCLWMKEFSLWEDVAKQTKKKNNYLKKNENRLRNEVTSRSAGSYPSACILSLMAWIGILSLAIFTYFLMFSWNIKSICQKYHHKEAKNILFLAK